MEGPIASASSRLDAGLTTAGELVDASLAAIDAHNGRTNAYVTVHADRARHAARAIDDERRRGVRRGPLHGIPISIKDLIDEAGIVTTAGSRVLVDRLPERDATVVGRLRDAGAIVIGRTNLHEFALGTTSDSSAFGPVRHPHDPGRSAGGSSGGSAAAVATGMGLASVGTDTGGSIRIPAAACGLVGIKPAHGDVPVDGVVPLSSSLDHVGPLAVTVQDAAWMLALLSGRRPWRVREIPASGVRLRRLRGDFEDPVSDEVREAFDRSMRALQAAGAVLTDGTIDGTAHIAAAYTRIVLAEAAAWHARYLDERPGDYTPIVRERLEHGRTVPAVDYLEAQAFRRTLRASVDRALEGVDALVLPTLPIVAPPLGAEVIVVGANATDVPVRAAMLKHTQPFNMTGHPAVTVPAPAPGLPVGIQLVAAADRTPRLLEIAAVCERLLTS